MIGYIYIYRYIYIQRERERERKRGKGGFRVVSGSSNPQKLLPPYLLFGRIGLGLLDLSTHPTPTVWIEGVCLTNEPWMILIGERKNVEPLKEKIIEIHLLEDRVKACW